MLTCWDTSLNKTFIFFKTFNYFKTNKQKIRFDIIKLAGGFIFRVQTREWFQSYNAKNKCYY